MRIQGEIENLRRKARESVFEGERDEGELEKSTYMQRVAERAVLGERVHKGSFKGDRECICSGEEILKWVDKILQLQWEDEAFQIPF